MSRIKRALLGKAGPQSFLRQVMTLMSGTALAQLMPLLASPIIARLYSPTEMGAFTAFMSLVGGVVTISTWRYDLAIVLPKRTEDARALVKLASRLNALTCMTLGLALLIFAGPITDALGLPELKQWLVGVALVSWAFAQVSIFNYWCNRHQKYGLLAANRVGQAATTTGTQLGLGALAFGTTGLVVSTLLGQLVSAANLFWRTRRDIYGQPRSSLRAVMSEHKKMPLLNAPTAILDTIRVNGVQLMINAFFSSAMLGQFGQAWRLLQAPSALINSALSQVFYQRLATVQRGHLTSLVRASIARSALIGIVPFVLILLLSPPLFPVVFGGRWALAGQIGSALVPWLYMNFITSPVSTVFVVTRRQGTLFWFGLPFTAAPLLLILVFHADMLRLIWALSFLMAGMLGCFLILAMWVSRGFDKGVGLTDTGSDQPPVGPSGAQLPT